MLSGYSTYLLNIRNNLIQCGVEVPVTPIQDYFDVCMLESELDDILWFYRVLAVSGSEYALSDFFLPLNGYFREKMRSIYYQEFLDFLQDYKTIGVEELRSKYISSGGGAYKNIGKDETEDIPVSEEEELSFGSEEQDDEEVINWDDGNWEDDDDVGSGDSDSNSEEDIQWDDEEEEDEEEESIFSGEKENDSPFGDSSYDFEKYSPHGVYIEDLILEDSKKSEENDLSDEDSDEDGLGGYYNEEESDEDDLGGYEEDDEEESSDEDGLGGYYEEESDEDGLGGYYEEDDYSDEDGLGGYEEDDYSDEDGLGSYDDEDFSDEDGLGGYYDDEVDDQDCLGGYEDDEEDYSDQDGLGSYNEDDYSVEDGLGGYNSSEDEEPLEAVVPDIPAQSEEIPKPNTPPPRDLSDALQDFVNGSLTSAKRSIRSIRFIKTHKK